MYTRDTASKYEGTKQVFAWPMNRLAYNEYRRWALPDDENGDDNGYLIEYTDGGKSNHPDHEGYISWSPADVFDHAYRPCGTWRARLQIEYDQLQARLNALDGFGKSSDYMQLPEQGKRLLSAQYSLMHRYLNILENRMELADAAQAPDTYAAPPVDTYAAPPVPTDSLHVAGALGQQGPGDPNAENNAAQRCGEHLETVGQPSTGTDPEEAL